MTQFLNLKSANIVNLNVVPRGQAGKLTNLGGGTLTLRVGGPASSTSYALAANQSRLLNGPAWVEGGVTARLMIDDAPAPAENTVNPNSRHWVGGISPIKQGSGAGSNTTVTENVAYVGQLNIANRCTLTGIRFLVGTTGGTSKALVVLYDAFGAPLAWSDPTGTVVGTGNQFQALPFTSLYEVVTPGSYFGGVAYNEPGAGTTATATLQVEDGSAGTAGATSVIGGTVASAVDFSANPGQITPPSSPGVFAIFHTY